MASTSQIPDIRIEDGEKFFITFPNGKLIELDYAEWLGFRFAQNSLIHTEPVPSAGFFVPGKEVTAK
jgi:hypothetical protein